MEMVRGLPRLAVLIDAENASASIADNLFEEIATLGEATVRRIYGDFSGTRLKGWSEVAMRLAIVQQQQQASVKGKNAADIALVIDAMTLLHVGNVDGFCLVSSDSDFSRLATEIRERGQMVYGFGEQKTPESLRNACHRFIYFENFALNGEDRDPPEKTERNTQAKRAHRPPSKAVPLINKAIAQLNSDDGWVELAAVGSQLGNLNSDFDPRTYGEKKLSDLMRKAGAFDVETSNQSRGLRIRKKARSGKRAA